MAVLNNSADIFVFIWKGDCRDDFYLHADTAGHWRVMQNSTVLCCVGLPQHTSGHQHSWHSCPLMIISIPPIIRIAQIAPSLLSNALQRAILFGLRSTQLNNLQIGLLNVGSTETHMISGGPLSWKEKIHILHV